MTKEEKEKIVNWMNMLYEEYKDYPNHDSISAVMEAIKKMKVTEGENI